LGNAINLLKQVFLLGIYPVVSDHYLALAKDGKLGVGKLTVHCPNKECKYYAPDYDPNKWNDLMG
jgi:hypothetical protein